MERIMAESLDWMWSGAVSLEHGDGWVKPWRLDFGRRDFFHSDLRTRAENPAGVRLCFETNSCSLGLFTEAMTLSYYQVSEIPFDLCVNGNLFSSLSCKAGSCELIFEGLPTGMKRLEVWLNPNCVFKLKSLGIDDGTELRACVDRRPRWICYGSSITHCGAAASPSQTWPGLVATARGLELTCLGYGGQCHLDPVIGRMIGGLSAELISLKLGINVQGAATMAARTFAPAVIGLIESIRDGHPDTPLLLCSPVYSFERENCANAVGLDLRMMRAIIADIVALFRSHGDRNIHYIDGLKLMGGGEAERFPDRLHPDAEGYRMLASNFIRELDGLELNIGGRLE